MLLKASKVKGLTIDSFRKTRPLQIRPPEHLLMANTADSHRFRESGIFHSYLNFYNVSFCSTSEEVFLQLFVDSSPLGYSELMSALRLKKYYHL